MRAMDQEGSSAEGRAGLLLRARRFLRPRYRVKRAWAKARHRRRQRRLAGRKIMRAVARARPRAFFLEIGSNDGHQLDHLHETIDAHPWRGVMVEPVGHVFERLERNYGDNPRVELERAAIADRDGTLPFFHLRPVEDPGSEGLPHWYDAIGSFSREHLERHRDLIPDVEERIEAIEVPCLTLDSLCRKHSIGRIDVLQIDTEGHDLRILGQVDLARLRPLLIIYEHYHLSPEEQAASRQRLESHGYLVMEEGFDSWCLDREASETRLIDTWERLRPGRPAVHAENDPTRGGAQG